MKCGEYIDLFLAYLATERGLSDATLDAYSADLRSFLKKSELDITSANRYLLGLKDAKSSTIWRKRSAIAQFFRFLWQEGVLKEDVSSELYRPKKYTPQPKAMSQDAIQGMFQELEKSEDSLRRVAMIKMIYDSAMRVSECVSVKMKDFKSDKVLVIGKREKYRWVFINRDTEEKVKEYIKVRNRWSEESNPYLWGVGAKKHVVRQTVHFWLKDAGKKLGLEISPHMLRHTQATKMLNNETNIIDLAAILGHSSVNTTSAYLKVCSSDLRHKLEKFHPLGRGSKR